MASSKIDSAHINSHVLSDSRRKVRIVGKIRGFLESEAKSFEGPPWISVQKSDAESSNDVKISLKDQTSSSKDFRLDYCYEQHEDTSQIFSREVKPLLLGILKGFNASVIVYGARGSGKTYTIQGSDEKPGLAALAMAEVLSKCEENGSMVKISCYEVYHDHVYDLLEPKEQEVLVWEDKGRIQLKGLSQVHVKSISEFNRLYCHGYDQQKPAQKIANDVVRRSHKGLIIYVCSRNDGSSISVVGKMNFVDLAGYEDARRMSVDVPHLADIPRINKSLFAVENVVHALNANERHVPFRVTKLTRMLQDSIGGASQALMITCLNPKFCQDTIHIISWASRSFQAANLICQDSAKKVKSSAKIIGFSSPPASRTKSISTSTKTLGGSLFHSTEKKTSNVPHDRKERNLFTVGKPALKSAQENSSVNVDKSITTMEEENSSVNVDKSITTIEEENSSVNVDMPIKPTEEETSALSVAKTIENLTLEEERCLQSTTNTIEPFTPRGPRQDACMLGDVEFDQKPLTVLEDEKIENSYVGVERSPPISSKLREITNALKAFSTPISLGVKSPNEDTIKKSHACSYLTESLNPGVPVNFRIDEWESVNASTPGETFKARSCGLKKSLVEDYLKFLNSASKDELKELKGIGEKRANYILELREESSEPFKNLDDLKEIGLSSKQINSMMRKLAGQLFS